MKTARAARALILATSSLLTVTSCEPQQVQEAEQID